MPDDEYDKLLKAFYTCFRDTDAGVVVLRDLESKFYRRTFITNPIDANAILINEGSREVVVYILSKIEEFELDNGRR